MSLDLRDMQREIRKMAAASHQNVLQRLTEEWERSQDASFYKELEMEKKRWMMSALHNMEGHFRMDSRSETGRRASPGPVKILALYESQGKPPQKKLPRKF